MLHDQITVLGGKHAGRGWLHMHTCGCMRSWMHAWNISGTRRLSTHPSREVSLPMFALSGAC